MVTLPFFFLFLFSLSFFLNKKNIKTCGIQFFCYSYWENVLFSYSPIRPLVDDNFPYSSFFWDFVVYIIENGANGQFRCVLSVTHFLPILIEVVCYVVYRIPSFLTF